MNTYHIDGSAIVDLPLLFAAFAKGVNAPGGYFGKNLDAFDDCLFGGYGLECPCVVVWHDADVARRHLGSQALVQYCQSQMDSHDHSADGLVWLTETLARAQRGERTLFGVVVEMISSVSDRTKNRQLALTLMDSVARE